MEGRLRFPSMVNQSKIGISNCRPFFMVHFHGKVILKEFQISGTLIVFLKFLIRPVGQPTAIFSTQYG